jgi:hypothetical protein
MSSEGVLSIEGNGPTAGALTESAVTRPYVLDIMVIGNLCRMNTPKESHIVRQCLPRQRSAIVGVFSISDGLGVLAGL